MAIVSMKSLLETGVHFGHRSRRWNPKMKQYIFTQRNGIHILDLQQTVVKIDETYNLVRDIVAEGGEVLFVGTKRQAQATVAYEAGRAFQPYVNERWLGGTLTNWQTIRRRISHLEDLEARRDAGEFELLKKKERLGLEREIAKLEMRLGGVRKMRKLPELLFVVDINNEETAVREANKLDIPIAALVDTNCDPEVVDYVIPANDDAIRAIKLIVGAMAEAAIEGLAIRQELLSDEEKDGSEGAAFRYDDFEDAGDEQLLGEATLAKMREGVGGGDAAAGSDASVAVEAAAEVVEEAGVAEVAEVVEEAAAATEEAVAAVTEESSVDADTTVGSDEENE